MVGLRTCIPTQMRKLRVFSDLYSDLSRTAALVDPKALNGGTEEQDSTTCDAM